MEFDQINSKIQGFIDALNDDDAESHLQGSAKTIARHRRAEAQLRMSKLRSWRLLDGNQIVGILDAHPDLRHAFDGFLTPGDILADLSALSPTLSDAELGPALKQHARWALIGERSVYFDEAGGGTKGVPVEKVVIDLPVHVAHRDSSQRVIRYVMERGEHLLTPSLDAGTGPRHLVLVGAPGNGKSTVSKFLVHAYRATLIGDDDQLGGQHREAIAETDAAVTALVGAPPTHRRWPIRVDLAEFAKRKATDHDFTLLTWIAEVLSKQVASKPVARWTLWPWFKAWPSFLALDGLDEVTEPAVRKGLIADITAFVADAEANDCDMLVLVTTRPTGYADELLVTDFERIDLADLSVDDALRYGRRVTELRIPDDLTRRTAVESLLGTAAKDDALRPLLRTPLQVLIMSIIAETAHHFSPSRYALFWGFYGVVEAREKAKTMGYSRLLRDHAPQILDLHQRVGLRLQEQAEAATGATAALSQDELRDVAWQVLADADYKPSTSDAELLDDIVTAATHRLVLLAPRGDEGYGFDVRSLQELMAAHALTTGSIDDSISRLRKLAASPHWRNTWLFAAGRYFAEPQPINHEAITNCVTAVDEDADHRLAKIFPVGPQLALEAVDDGMAAAYPKWQYRLVKHALRLLDQPAPYDPAITARMLVRAATVSREVRELIRDGLRAALGGTSTSRETAAIIQGAIGHIAEETDLPTDVRSLSLVKRDPALAAPSEPTPDWRAFDDLMNDLADDVTRPWLERVAKLIHEIAQTANLLSDPITDIDDAIAANADVAQVVQEALGQVAEGSPNLIAILRESLMPITWRHPVEVPK